MVRVSPPTLRKPAKGFASAFAMAIALAGGTIIAAAGIATPAQAKQKEEKQKATYSKAFVEAYSPVNDAVNAAADEAAATALKPQLAAVTSSAQSPDERFAAGNLYLQVGIKSKDKQLQRQGLEQMVASGKADPANLGQYQYYIGQLAYDAGDYAASRTAFEAAIAAGFKQDNYEAMIAETYFKENRNQEGLAYLSGLIKPKLAAGEKVPNTWPLRGLSVAYQANMPQQAAEFALMAVENEPTKNNWTAAVQVVRETNQYAAQETLDLSRIMLETDSFGNARDYFEYIEAADARRMPNEVVRVIDHGVAAGMLKMSDVSVKEAYDLAKGRAAADRTETPTLVGEARSSSSGVTALGVADSFLSFNDAANAEEMYNLALQKGGVDQQRVLTRIGICQIKEGKFAEAKATLAKVTGPRKPIADLWIALANSKTAG